MIEVWSSRSRTRRKGAEGERERRRTSSSEATFHPWISQNGAREEKWECQFHIGSTQQRLIRVGLRASIQYATRLTIINKAITTLNPVEGSQANTVNVRFRDLFCHLISFCLLFLSLSFSFFLYLSRDFCIYFYVNPSRSRHICISRVVCT